MNVRKIVAVALVVVGALATLPTLSGRLARERDARPVDLVLDLKSYRQLAQQEGLPLQQLLSELHGAGATAVAVPEDDMETLRQSGLATILTGSELQGQLVMNATPHPLLAAMVSQNQIRPTAFYFVTGRQDVAARLESALSRRLQPGRVKAFAGQAPSPLYVIEAQSAFETLSKLGFDFNPADFQAVEAAGLRVMPRPRNFPAVKPDEVERYFAKLMADAPSTKSIVFEGDAVLGAPDALSATAAAFQKYDLRLALIENAEQRGYINQRGQDQLAEMLNWKVTRLFGISADYIAKLGPESTVDTWMRGVIDRSMRAIYMRPWTKDLGDGRSVLQVNVDQVRYFTAKLADDGYTVGLGGYYTPLITRIAVHFLQALGVVGGMLLWLLWVYPGLGTRTYSALLALGVLGVAVLSWYGKNHLVGYELLALGAACVYPTLAVTAVLRRWAGDKPLVGAPGTLEHAGREGVDKLSRAWLHAGGRWGRMLGEGLWATLVVSGLSAIGGFLVASLMGDIKFMLEFGYFLGVKVAFFIPLLLIVVSFVLVGREKAGVRAGADVRKQLKTYLSMPITYGYAVLGLVAMVGLFWYLQRSGNTPLVPVPQWELRMRDWLEKTLVARPREKEFMIGYPLLMIGTALWVRGLRNWLLPFALAAGTGAVSVVNSFSHIRTGVYIAALRWLNGLWLGVVISTVVAVVAVLLLTLVVRLAVRGSQRAGKGTRA